MKNIKFITCFSICGFLLSFFAGLFSGSHFGIVLIHAVIFAAVFAGMGFAIQFVYGKFLAEDAEVSVASASSGIKGGHASSGNVVDITISDDDLPAEENSPQFFVGTNHQMLNKNDYKSSDMDGQVSGIDNLNLTPESEEYINHSVSKTGTDTVQNSAIDDVADLQSVDEKNMAPVSKSVGAQKKTQPDSGFIPVPLQETVKNASAKEPDVEALKDDSLDELPDLEDVEQDMSEVQAGGTESEFVDNSDFASAGQKKNKVNDDKNMNDAALMAKAISTVLAKEKQ